MSGPRCFSEEDIRQMAREEAAKLVAEALEKVAFAAAMAHIGEERPGKPEWLMADFSKRLRQGDPQ